MDARAALRLQERGEGWGLVGESAAGFGLVDEYLSHLLDRNYSRATVRAYGYDLLAFCRWLSEQDVDLAAVDTTVLLDYLRACRETRVPGRPGPNVVTMSGQRLDRYAARTINRRLAAISGLFTFRELRDPEAKSPVPRVSIWTVERHRVGGVSATEYCARVPLGSAGERRPRWTLTGGGVSP